MGRIIETPTQLVWNFKEKWKPLTDNLRKKDADVFGDLIAFAHYHAAPVSFTKSLNPFEPFVLVMLIEMEKQIKELQRERINREMIIDEAEQ